MTDNVRIEFLGLTDLVPNRKSVDDPIESCLVVLPDLEYGLTHEELPGPIPPHLPAVIVRKESVICETRKHAQMNFQCRSGDFSWGEYSLYSFNGERLTLDGIRASALEAEASPIEPDRHSTCKPTAPGEENKLQWIPRLALANHKDDRQVGVFDRDRFLNPNLTPRNNHGVRLAGTVVAEHGRLYVEDVMRTDGEPELFDFRIPGQEPTEWQQAMFTRILWDAQLDNDHVDLVFCRNDGECGVVTIQPVHGRCDVWIANLEVEDLLGIGQSSIGADVADLDYSVHYLFSKGVKTEARNLPVPHFPQNIIAGGSPRCKNTLFEL